MRVFLIAIFLLVAGVAGAEEPSRVIKNFSPITETIYRGSRPNGAQVEYLALGGVKTIINLQGGDAQNPYIGFAVPWFVQGETPAEIEQARAEAVKNGVNFVHLPLNSLAKLSQQEKERILQALKIMGDPNMHPVYIHCAFGIDRTGLLTAMYRMVYQGWSVFDAHAEMMEMGHNGFRMAMTFNLDAYLFSYAFQDYLRTNLHSYILLAQGAAIP